MKNLIKSILLISGIMVLFTSCESMLSDVDAPVSDPKLVVTAFLSPYDDTISISVRKSRPLYVPTTGYSDPFPFVSDATVTISDGMNSLNIPYSVANGKYLFRVEDMPIIPGKTYTLLVTTPDGYHAASHCTVPAETAPVVEVTSIDTLNQGGTMAKKVSLRFRDLPGNGHFYRLSVGAFYKYEYNAEDFFSEVGFERGMPFVSDKNKDGEYFTFRTTEIYAYNTTNDSLYISLLVTDENYYNYHRSFNTNQGDNPFSEPSPVYSNIEGGLGVFAGINGKITAYHMKTAK